MKNISIKINCNNLLQCFLSSASDARRDGTERGGSVDLRTGEGYHLSAMVLLV